MSKLDQVSHELLVQLGQGPKQEQIHLATYQVKPEQLKARGFSLIEDKQSSRILRSVLMRPEQVEWVPRLHTKVSDLAAKLIG